MINSEAIKIATKLGKSFGMTGIHKEDVVDDVLDHIYDEYEEQSGTPDFDDWKESHQEAINFYTELTENGISEEVEVDPSIPVDEPGCEVEIISETFEHINTEREEADVAVAKAIVEEAEPVESILTDTGDVIVVTVIPNSKGGMVGITQEEEEEEEVSQEIVEEMGIIEEELGILENEVIDLKVEVDSIEEDMENPEPEMDYDPEQFDLFIDYKDLILGGDTNPNQILEITTSEDFSKLTMEELKEVISKKKNKPKLQKVITRARKAKRDVDEFGFVKGTTQAYFITLVQAGKYTSKQIKVMIQEKSNRGIHAMNALEKKLLRRGRAIFEDPKNGLLTLVSI